MHGNEAWRCTDSIESMLLEHSIQTNTKKNIKIIDISLIVLSIKFRLTRSCFLWMSVTFTN